MLTIAVIGHGFCGSATSLLENPSAKFLIYDIVTEKCRPLGLKMSDLAVCDIIFICTPSPKNPDGSCHTDIVENVVRQLKSCVDTRKTHLVIRSTVPPHTSERLDTFFMPEFLTEKNWHDDVYKCPLWIVGCKNGEKSIIDDFMEKIRKLLISAKSYGKIQNDDVQFVSTSEAEMIKYFRNNFLSLKVSFCNEMEEFCRRSNIDYETVRKYAVKDSRIGESHTCVPGPDGQHGFGGSCFPKDTSALLFEMDKIMDSYIVYSCVRRNSNVDRPNYVGEKGRACV